MKLKVHGYFSDEDLERVKVLAAEHGLENDVMWLNQVPMPQALDAYRASQVCVLPFMGSSVGLAAATAAAAALPVVGTKNAGIWEHLGDNVAWIEKDNAEEIAAQVEKLLRSKDLHSDLSRRVRRRAEECLGWDAIARSKLAVYRRAAERMKTSAHLHASESN